MRLHQLLVLTTAVLMGIGAGAFTLPTILLAQGPARFEGLLTTARQGRVKATLQQALDRIPTLEDLDQRVWALCRIARTQARADLRAAAAATVRKAIRAALDTEADDRLIDVAELAAQLGDTKDAAAILDALDDPGQRACGLARVSAALTRRGELRGARTTLEQIGDAKTWRNEALQAMAAAQAEAGDFRGALATRDKIAGQTARGWLLTVIATQQLRGGDRPAALRTLQDALQAAEGTKRGPGDRDDATLSVIAGVQAEAGQPEEARKTAEKIRQAPWQDQAWGNMVTAQVRQGDTGGALATAERIRDDYYQSEAVKQIVVGLVRANDLTAAGRMVDRIKLPVWRGYALLEIGTAQARSGQHPAAEKTFQQVLQEAAGVRDTESIGNVKPALLSHLAAAQASVGEETAARAWIDRQADGRITVYARLGLAEGIIKQQQAPLPPKVGPEDEEVITATVQVFDSHPKAEEAELARLLDKRRRPARPTAAPKRQPGENATFRGKIILFGCSGLQDPFGALIQAVHPDGSGLETILELEPSESIVAGRVAPDGLRLAFSVQHGQGERAEVWTLEANGRLRKIASDGRVQAWSPDGTRLACYRGRPDDMESFLLDVATGQEQRLPIPKTDCVNDWSHDGKRLAVVAGNPTKTFNHPTKGVYPLRKIYLLGLDGSGREDLKADPLLDNIVPRFSPDDKQLVYHQRKHQDGRVLHYTVVYPLDGTGAREVFQFDTFFKGNRQFKANGFPCWSPDGRQVVWRVPRRQTVHATLKMEMVFIATTEAGARRLDLYGKGLRFVAAMDWR
jgi:Tol biopolymer transport system component